MLWKGCAKDGNWICILDKNFVICFYKKFFTIFIIFNFILNKKQLLFQNQLIIYSTENFTLFCFIVFFIFKLTKTLKISIQKLTEKLLNMQII